MRRLTGTELNALRRVASGTWTLRDQQIVATMVEKEEHIALAAKHAHRREMAPQEAS